MERVIQIQIHPSTKTTQRIRKVKKTKRGRVPNNRTSTHNGRVVCTWVPTNKLLVNVLVTVTLEDDIDIVSARRMLLIFDPVCFQYSINVFELLFLQKYED